MSAGKKQKGFTLMGAMIMVAAMGAGLAVYEEGKDIMIAVEEADREMYAAKAIRKRKAPVTR